MRWRFSTVVVSASSQVMRCQPGSGAAFRTRTLQWVKHACFTIDVFGGGLTFSAKRLSRRVIGIGFNRNEAAIFNDPRASATRHA